MLQLSGKVCCALKMTLSTESVARNLSSSPITKQREDTTSDFWRPFLATHTQNQRNAVLPDYNKNPTTRKFKKEVLSV